MGARQIFFDTETTGLSKAGVVTDGGHRIIEIGLVEMKDRQLTGQRLHLYVNPDRDIDPEAQAVHGITREMLADKPRFPEVVDQILAFIKDAELVAHNASFDQAFLDMELRRANRGVTTDYCTLTDTLQLARALFPGKRNSLDALCSRLGVDNSHRTLHGALRDAELLAEVYLAMTRGQDSLVVETPEYLATDHPVANDMAMGELLVLHATEAERQTHEAYLADLEKTSRGQCLWRRLLTDS